METQNSGSTKSWFTPFGSFFKRSKRPRPVETAYSIPENSQDDGRLRRLGTFGGVFTPSFLTIIGVIMYLRFSWIVGNAGLFHTIIIVLLANSITAITALSVSSISTSMRMEGGGAYYIISRVMGAPAGGSLGIALFFSQAISIALYTIGFCEVLALFIPNTPIQTLSLIILGAITLLSLLGAGFMTRIQYIILAAIILSLVSIFSAFHFGHAGVLQPNYSDGASFWSVFAVFFPAVTGILAGVSMSGDLKNPTRSIPLGILSAIAAGFAIYIAVPIFLAFSARPETLASSEALSQASRWPVLVQAGVLGATISSAIGSILAAPRTLQALADDGITPGFLRIGIGEAREPIPALLVSVAIAAVTIMLGNLNTVAAILTMFFLTSYGVLNLSAAFESFVANPSFRPTIRIPWPVSFLGALGCIAVMFLIEPVFAAVAWLLIAIVFFVLSRRHLKQEYGDIWEGLWHSLMITASNRLKNMQSSGKNWRPLVQLFASQNDSHEQLISLAQDLTGDGGVFSLYTLTEGNIEQIAQAQDDEQAAGSEKATGLQTSLPVKQIICKDFRDGVFLSAQAEGFGAGSYNTVLLGMSQNTKKDKENAQLLRELSFLQKNIIMMKKTDVCWKERSGPITIWWGGQENNVRLMLILADLLRANDVQNGRQLKVKSIIRQEEERPNIEQLLQNTLDNLHIPAETEIIVRDPEKQLDEHIRDGSVGSALVFLGLAVPAHENMRRFYSDLRVYSQDLPSVLFVRNNSSSLPYE